MIGHKLKQTRSHFVAMQFDRVHIWTYLLIVNVQDLFTVDVFIEFCM